MTTVKYLDLSILATAGLLTALAGLPIVGFAFAAGAWVLSRAIAEYLEHRASAGSPADRLSMQAAGMIARLVIVLTAVVAARYVGDREDGIMAAALALVVFTVHLGTSVVIRQLERNVVRP